MKLTRAIGWTARHEDELRWYFTAGYLGDMGLRSGLGAQLDRARDEVSGGHGVPDTGPPKAVENGDAGRAMRRRQRVERTLLTIPHECVHALRCAYGEAHPGAWEGLEQLDPRRAENESEDARPQTVRRLAHLTVTARALAGAGDYHSTSRALRRLCGESLGRGASKGEKVSKTTRDAAKATLDRVRRQVAKLLEQAQSAYARAREDPALERAEAERRVDDLLGPDFMRLAVPVLDTRPPEARMARYGAGTDPRHSDGGRHGGRYWKEPGDIGGR